MRTIEVQQGSDSWHAERARRFTASEAPAVMGASKYLTRSQLLHQKATGIVPEVDAAKQRLFDRGHEAEAAARAIVEDMIGEDLYPATGVHETDDRLLASMDGITMLETIIFEHKLWSEDLAAQVRSGELEPHYYWQLEAQLLVSGAEKAIFVCSDGTRERFVSMEYRPVPGRAEQLLAAWEQFERDLAAYVPPAAAEPVPTGRAPDSLPALRIELTGAVTASNLAEFKATALGAIQAVNRNLKTDADFADAEQAVKWCGEVESRIKAAKEHALSQTASIDELFRTLDDVSGEARRVRLDLEKLVERRKVEIKGEMVAAAKAAYERHESALRQECGAWKMLPPPDFGSAIKGKRNVQAMQDALDTTLANAKIKADEQARAIRAALAALDEESKGHEHLFRDRLDFIMLPPDVVRQMARGRIAEHRAAEERRAAELAERERERIRTEEAVKARAEQEAIAPQERQRQESAAREQRQREEEAARAAGKCDGNHGGPRCAATPGQCWHDEAHAAAPFAPPAASSPVANVVPMQRPTPAPATPPTLTLGTDAMTTIQELPAHSEADAAFDRWYAMQAHQLSNEQVCRLIWRAAWQACDGDYYSEEAADIAESKARAALAAQASAIDAEALIIACVPGGYSCDPQQVADAIRAYFANPPAQPALRAFANAILDGWPDSSPDGFEIQDAAVANGLLQLKSPKPTEPCGEHCWCAAYFDHDEWQDGVQCYERSAILTGEAQQDVGLCEAYARAAQVEQWKPIETAPKDGRWFLAWRREAVVPYIVRWDAAYDAAENTSGEHVYHLTHWQPITPPDGEDRG